MIDLACRNIAGGAPASHSSHKAACCRISPFVDDKASTRFLAEKEVVSKVLQSACESCELRAKTYSRASDEGAEEGQAGQTSKKQKAIYIGVAQAGEMRETNERGWMAYRIVLSGASG